jgi:integrase
MRIRLSYVKTGRDQYGTLRRWFRRPGQSLVPLPGRPGSPEFMAVYNKALGDWQRRQVEIGKARSPAGSLGAIVAEYYQDRAFLGLADSTRGMRRRILEKYRAKVGGNPLRDLQRGHIVSVMLAGLPPFERANRLKTLRHLIKFAIERGYLETDPTAGIKGADRREAGSIHTWTESEIMRFRARHGLGTTPRLALELFYNTAQRLSDVYRMGPQHIKDGILYVQQQKTRMQKDDRELAIPVLPELQRAIAATRVGDLVFLLRQDGVPFTRAGLGMRFGEWCEQAGLPDECSAHGLRKAACVDLLYAGCTPSEVMAISGHKNLAELKTYIEKAEQRRLGASAMAKRQAAREHSENPGGGNPIAKATPTGNTAQTELSQTPADLSQTSIKSTA